MSFAVDCDLKMSFVAYESDSAKGYDNFLCKVMDVQCHLKQRHATATCEGIRGSMPISSKCSDILCDIGTLVPLLLSPIFNHLIFIAI